MEDIEEGELTSDEEGEIRGTCIHTYVRTYLCLPVHGVYAESILKEVVKLIFSCFCQLISEQILKILRILHNFSEHLADIA